ncbi:hypothetical protein FHS96_002991 [Sphingomonas zeicaulis]|uniref:sensor histidine kinase n=1 Tax=Sphingomonas zeicaulis TaxID=1632740 RepID=UPI003D1E13F5
MFRRIGLDSIGTTRRATVYFIAFYTLATALLGLAAYLVGDRAVRDQLDDRISAEADYLEDVHEQGGLDRLKTVLQRRDDRGVNALGYLLVDRGGGRQGGELGISPPPPGWRTIEFTDPDGQKNAARALTLALNDGGRLTVVAELEPARQLRRTTAWVLAVGIGAILLGGIAGGLLFSRAIRSRLDAMNDTAQAIIAGDMSQRVPISDRDDEFGRLATTLNLMLDRNSMLIDNLRQVSSDIAHDLRTPLAHLRQRLERALARTGSDGKLHCEVEAAIAQSGAILSLFGALLRISEVESGTLRQFFRPIDLSAVVGALCESYLPAAEDRGKRLDCRIEPDLGIVGDEELVAQALVNLLENALRHTPPGTRIALDLRRDGGFAELTVSDDGPGVPDAQLPELTRRFTRGDRSRAGGGFGLGLNLVNAIAIAHDGTLRLSNGATGLIAKIRIPACAHRG